MRSDISTPLIFIPLSFESVMQTLVNTSSRSPTQEYTGIINSSNPGLPGPATFASWTGPKRKASPASEE